MDAAQNLDTRTRAASTVWQMGTSSNSRSFEIESWAYISHKDYNLQLLQKVETESTREKIPATWLERLSYFRLHTTAIYKTQMISIYHISFNRFLWYHIYNTLCKSLPTNYVYYFLSSYSPDQHLYAGKMCPLFYGFNYLVLICGLIDLAQNTELLMLLLDYSFFGIFQRSPWNTCHEEVVVSILGHRMLCYNTEKFKYLVTTFNGTFSNAFYEITYPNGTINYINLSVIEYLRYRLRTLQHLRGIFSDFTIHFIVIWLAAGLLQTQIYKKRIWTILRRADCTLNAIYILVCLHLIIINLESDLPVVENEFVRSMDILWRLDIDMLAESTTSPPVVHFLTARSSDQVRDPARSSSLMVASNALFYFMRGILYNQLKQYVQSVTNAQVQYKYINLYPIFYIWPLYLNKIYFGNISSGIFYVLNFLVEFLTFSITYQCLVETIVTEWPKVKRWMVVLVCTAFSFYLCGFWNTPNDRLVLFFFSKGIPTLIEITIIVCIYPLARLVDDVTFQYGNPPSKIIIRVLILVPILYVIKLYLLLDAYGEANKQGPWYQWGWSLFLIPIAAGFIFIIGYYICYQKRDWRMVFRPLPHWGPREHIQRQLRKQYDSRDYVRSTASRYLSRYLTSKAEAQTYRLDIYYQKAGRRSTVIQENIRWDQEKRAI